MTEYYKHLDLGIDSILKDESILYTNPPEQCQYRLSILDLNPDFVRLIEQKNLLIMIAEVFRLDAAHRRWGVHIDGFKTKDFPKLNFIHGNKQSPMIWYKTKEEQDKTSSETVTGTPYRHLEDDEVIEVDRALIEYPTLIQAGVPHTVQLIGNETRWVVSIALFKDFKLPSIQDLSEVFKEYHKV